MSVNWTDKDLGVVSAFGVAKKNGWTGTEAEWEALQAAAPQAGSDAEAYAAGTRSGEAVESDDPAYHNNANYYAGQASGSATAAAGSATEAAASAAEAAQYTSDAVHTWLEENIDPDSGYALDRTLTEPLEAAPADLVGSLKSAIDFTVDSSTEPFGINLFDYSKSENVLENQAMDASGNIVSNANFCIAQNIPVVASNNYALSVKSNSVSSYIRILAFNGSTFLSKIAEFAASTGTKTFTTPANCTNLKVSTPKAVITSLQIENGSASTLVDGFTFVDNVARNSADGNGNTIKSITESYGKNIYNPLVIPPVNGYGLNDNGVMIANKKFTVTDYIPIAPSRSVVVSFTRDNAQTIRCCAYNSSKTFVQTVFASADASETSKQFSGGASYAYIMISYPEGHVNNIQIEYSSSATAYENGYTSIDKKARTALDDIKSHTSFVISPDDWEQGNLDTSGEPFADSKRIRTGFFDVGYGSVIKYTPADSTHYLTVAFYDEQHNFLSKAIWWNVAHEIRVTGHAIRFVARINDTTITPSVGSEFAPLVVRNPLYKRPLLFGIDTYLNDNKMQYAAHRGARLDAPENSIPAFELAGEQGYEWLNLAQIRKSADGTWYIMHNASIDDTTDGTGNIAELTDEYLETVHIDVGPNIEQYSQAQLVIPTLEDAIHIARKYGMKIYFRITAMTSNNYLTDKAGWDSFVAIIKKYRCENMIFGGNAFTDVLPLVRDMNLDWCINWDVSNSQDAIPQIDAYIKNGVQNATLFMPYTTVTKEIIQYARENGYKVMVYDPSTGTPTVTESEALHLSSLGVDILSSVVHFDLGA